MLLSHQAQAGGKGGVNKISTPCVGLFWNLLGKAPGASVVLLVHISGFSWWGRWNYLVSAFKRKCNPERKNNNNSVV
jgi:hypothetical protein